MTLKMDMLIIDPQNDFTDTPNAPGSLAVAGSYQDSLRLAQFIGKYGHAMNDIHVTLDSHHRFDVAHPLWWKNPITGEHPAPFTQLTSANAGAGKEWVPTVPYPGYLTKIGFTAESYIKALEDNHRYPLYIWPEHCLIGTPGQAVQKDIMEALAKWEQKETASVDFVTKGSNPFTEHYSAVQAEVQIPSDPGTMLNTQLIDMLKACDKIIISGQALSHCVANTVRDIGAAFGDANIKKMVLLRDTTSSVTGLEKLGDQFIADMTAMGMEVTTTKDFVL